MFKENILLVDDDRSTKSTIKNILSGEGYAVIRADSCSEALPIIQKER